MSENIEQYRGRYTLRPETFQAYVDVWNRVKRARQEFGDWVGFSRAANAEPKWQRERPERVAVATEIMEAAGYELGPPTARGARRWLRSSPVSDAPPREADEPRSERPSATSRSRVDVPDAPFVSELLASTWWLERATVDRSRLDESRVRAVFAALHAGGGVATFDAIAAATGLPVGRVSGLLAALAKKLNHRGDAVLVADPELREARLDVELLRLTIMGL